MKLRNKKTGEIKEYGSVGATTFADGGVLEAFAVYNSLAELNEEWEDYEEPKGSALDLMILTLINFIENEPDEDKVDLEDCKQMLNKLQACKRLKAKGFRFNSCKIEMNEIIVPEITITAFIDSEEPETLNLVNLLFGGEE